MCGIAGFIWTDPNRPAAADTVERMTRTIAHRGPDGEGFHAHGPVAFGHRRLSIIDLSDAAAQPMTSADGRHVIIFNGEIYNYLELRDELRSLGRAFHTASDTEVILHAFQQWGPACVTRFNGMWALAIHDRVAAQVFLSRDRLGIKPLHYVHKKDECFAFASEARAILAALPDERRPHRPLIAHFVPDGLLCDGPETFFENIRSLPPAHNAIYDIQRGTLTLDRYWEIDPDAFAARYAGGDPVQTLRELLKSAVKLHMRSDVPVGTCLSGGVDSSTIVGLMSRLRADPVHTFSGLYPDADCDESRYVDAVNEACGAIACPVRPSAGEDFLDELDVITQFQEMPTAGPGLYTQWHVMKRARSEVKVILDGQGGDELFAGYLPYFAQRAEDLAREGGAMGRLQAAWLSLGVWRHWGLRTAAGPLRMAIGAGAASRLRSAALRAKGRDPGAPPSLLHPALVADAERDPIHRPWTPHARGRLESLLERHVVEQSLPGLLHYEDRNSMAHSIEARVPLLDYRIVEFAFAVDSAVKIRGTWTKWILRKAAEPVLPAAVAWRRSKMGYPTPFARWLREPAIRDRAAELLFSRQFRQREIINEASLRRHWDQHQGGRIDQSWLIWRCITLELWHRQFIDGPAPPLPPGPEAARAQRGSRVAPIATT